MRRSCRDIPFCVGAAPAALAWLLSVPLPATGQTVVGHLVDARTDARLVGATVVLVDASLAPVRSVLSDTAGAFVLPSNGPGTYRILVERSGFASHLTDPLRLTGEGYYEERVAVTVVPLTVPGQGIPTGELALRESHLVEMCGPTFRPDRHGVLVGVALDTRTGRTVPGVVAEAEWPPSGRSDPGRLEITVGDEGYFVYCGIPADTPIQVRAVGGGLIGRPATTRAPPGGVARVDLPLGVTTGPASVEEEEGQGSVLGRVIDFATGEPVQGAEVRIDERHTALTDENGRFLLDEVEAGRRSMAVHHVAYPHQELILPVRGGAGHDVLIRLVSEAVPHAPLRVTVRSTRWFRDMRDFTRRSRSGVGHFFPPEDVALRQPAVLLDLVRSVPGVRVESGAEGTGTSLSMRGRRCRPSVIVDRARWGTSDPLTTIRGFELEAVEVYRGATEVPAEFMRPADDCGAVVVWTRRTREGAS